jgi:hypothetical protein
MSQNRNKNYEEMVELANKVSIVDFAKKHGLDIFYEDDRIAKTIDPDTNFEINIYKDNNSWNLDTEVDSNNDQLTYGNTIRFAARIIGMDYKFAIEKLVAEHMDYVTADQYNADYQRQQEAANTKFNEEVISSPVSNTQNSKKPAQTDEYQRVDENNHIAAGTLPVQDKGINNVNSFQQANNSHTNKVESVSPAGMPGGVFIGQSGQSFRRTYDKEQMAEILAGMKKGINIAAYDYVNLSPKQMREIRLALQSSINPLHFNFPFVHPGYMKEFRLAMKNGIDISLFEIKNGIVPFSPEQAKEIRLALQNGLELGVVRNFAKPFISPEAMKEIRLGIQDGFSRFSGINVINYSAKDLHTIRMTLVVQQILEAIATKFRSLYDSLVELFHKIVKENLYSQTDEINFGNEAIDLLKEATFDVYESMPDSFEEKALDERFDEVEKVLQHMKDNFDSMENAIDAQPNQIYEEVINNILDEQAQFALEQEASNNRYDEYVEHFHNEVNEYNVKLTEFTKEVLTDNNLTKVQKTEIIKETFGATYGDDFMNEWLQINTAQINQNRINDVQQAYNRFNQKNEIENVEEHELVP